MFSKLGEESVHRRKRGERGSYRRMRRSRNGVGKKSEVSSSADTDEAPPSGVMLQGSQVGAILGSQPAHGASS